MRVFLKKVSLFILLIVISITTFYFDYQYYNSFYHSLILLVLATVVYGTYIINKVLTEIVRIFRKWLGN